MKRSRAVINPEEEAVPASKRARGEDDDRIAPIRFIAIDQHRLKVLEWTPPSVEHANAITAAYRRYIKDFEEKRGKLKAFELVVDWLWGGKADDIAPALVPARADGTFYKHVDFCPLGYEAETILHTDALYRMAELPPAAGPVYWYTRKFYYY